VRLFRLTFSVGKGREIGGQHDCSPALVACLSDENMVQERGEESERGKGGDLDWHIPLIFIVFGKNNCLAIEFGPFMHAFGRSKHDSQLDLPWDSFSLGLLGPWL